MAADVDVWQALLALKSHSVSHPALFAAIEELLTGNKVPACIRCPISPLQQLLLQTLCTLLTAGSLTTTAITTAVQVTYQLANRCSEMWAVMRTCPDLHVAIDALLMGDHIPMDLVAALIKLCNVLLIDQHDYAMELLVSSSAQHIGPAVMAVIIEMDHSTTAGAAAKQHALQMLKKLFHQMAKLAGELQSADVDPATAAALAAATASLLQHGVDSPLAAEFSKEVATPSNLVSLIRLIAAEDVAAGRLADALMSLAAHHPAAFIAVDREHDSVAAVLAAYMQQDVPPNLRSKLEATVTVLKSTCKHDADPVWCFLQELNLLSAGPQSTVYSLTNRQ
eukprot:gene7274-7487_t